MNTLVKVLVGGAVVVLIAWGSLQFWLGRNGEDLRARGGVATEDGYAFASSTDQEGCVAEGLRRAGADQGIMDRALARVFVGVIGDAKEQLQAWSSQPLGTMQWVLDDMARGAEGYLQMWERAYGVAPDSCRNPEQQLPVATVQRRFEGVQLQATFVFVAMTAEAFLAQNRENVFLKAFAVGGGSGAVREGGLDFGVDERVNGMAVFGWCHGRILFRPGFGDAVALFPKGVA